MKEKGRKIGIASLRRKLGHFDVAFDFKARRFDSPRNEDLIHCCYFETGFCLKEHRSLLGNGGGGCF